MTTAILSSVQPSAGFSAAPRDLRTARPIRVATNAGSEACERLQGLGFAVRVLGAAALEPPWAADSDADIVLVDAGLTGTWSHLDAQKINAPVVLIVVDESTDAELVVRRAERCWQASTVGDGSHFPRPFDLA